ncbi:MAG: glycosyltransferase [Bacteroidota bacterium]
MTGVFKFGRAIWRRLPLPVSWRRLIGGRLAGGIKARMIPPPTAMADISPGPAFLAGFLSASLGIGEAARLLRASLERAGIAPVSLDLTPFLTGRPVGRLGGETVRVPGGALILMANAPETVPLLAEMGPELTHGRMRIGFWHWELPRLPEDWVTSAGHLHEVWAPSTFCAETYRAQLSVPVRVVPLQVETLPVHGDPDAFGLEAGCFHFLAAFDPRSSAGRKNPLAAVRAFRLAFGERKDVALVVKTYGLQPGSLAAQALDAEIRGAANIRILNRDLSRTDMHRLIQSCDGVVSLHRSEGFGLLIAEGLAYGKSVIATGWSGNMDFMSADNALPVNFTLVPVEDFDRVYRLADTVWAEPSIADAADKMRAVVDGAALRERLALAGVASIQAWNGMIGAKLGKAYAEKVGLS